MATHRELISYIRFQLDQIGARNAHHEFEHLCRHLARLRICSNILPATGPVTAGGDQGRDAETFRTYLANSPIGSSTFVGLASAQPVAFACTIQKKDNKLKTKIKNDVSKIMDSGQAVASIHYFCAADIDTSFRHEVEEWSRDESGVDLFILDGQAISEMLADQDTFWIATEFLGIPGEMYPQEPSAQGDDWYPAVLDAWKRSSLPALTYANFAEAKSALRHATVSPDRQQDVPFWLSKMEAFLSTTVAQSLCNQAIYEIAVATLRALGTMEGQEQRLQQYFGTIMKTAAESHHFSDLQDAAVLVTYCRGAVHQHAVKLTLDQVTAWRDMLIAELNRLLSQSSGPGRRCELLHILGYLTLMRELEGECNVHPSAFEIWLQMADLIREAPLFPLEAFIDYLNSTLPFIGDHPDYQTLTRQLDGLLAERVGQFAVAEKSRDRSIAFYKQGRILRAIAELHEAKVKWFAEETLQGSILAILFLVQCYRDLGLHYASKYYAMAAAWLAIRSSKPEILRLSARSLTQVALCEYALGNWYSAINVTDLSLRAHYLYVQDTIDLETHLDLDHAMTQAAVALSAAGQIDTRLERKARDVVDGWDWDEIDDLVTVAQDAWGGDDWQAVLRTVRGKIWGVPFGDVSVERETIWEALGITWRVHWSNEYRMTVVAEQLIVTLQVTLTDFAKHDLLLLKTEVDIEVVAAPIEFPDVEAVPSNEGRMWRVVLPESGSVSNQISDWHDAALFGVSVHVLREASVLSSSAFMSIFQDVMKGGITAKLFVARPYEDLYREMFPEDQLLVIDSNFISAVDDRDRLPAPQAHKELAWIDGPAPSYSVRDAHEAIERRYATIPAKIPVTLARLSQSEEFATILGELRTERWKDWHILLAVGNAVWNYRLATIHGSLNRNNGDVATLQSSIIDISKDLVLEGVSPVPLSEFTVERLRLMLDMSMASTVKGLGLEIHQETPDIPAIRNFLAHRFNHWVDDIPHDDPFSPPGEGIIILPTSAP